MRSIVGSRSRPLWANARNGRPNPHTAFATARSSGRFHGASEITDKALFPGVFR
jgi:hypothetical protein